MPLAPGASVRDKAAGLNLAAVVEEQDGRGREAAELVAQLTDLDRRAAEAASSFAKPGGITLLVLESTTAAIDRERTRVKKQLGELASGTLLAPYLSEPDSLREAWDHRLTIDQKRELIRFLVGRVRILTARRGMPRFDPDRVVWDPRAESVGLASDGDLPSACLPALQSLVDCRNHLVEGRLSPRGLPGAVPSGLGSAL